MDLVEEELHELDQSFRWGEVFRVVGEEGRDCAGALGGFCDLR